MDEIYKDVDGFPGYSVSNLGNVKGPRGGVLKLLLNDNGYLLAQLYKDGRTQQKRVHRLVAFAFVENPENKSDVDHIDNNRCNNNVANLRWATRSENMANQKVKSDKPKGVWFVKSLNKYRAAITINYKSKHLGCFDTIDAAADAYRVAAAKTFVEFAKY